jgi:hypothetical protein
VGPLTLVLTRQEGVTERWYRDALIYAPNRVLEPHTITRRYVAVAMNPASGRRSSHRAESAPVTDRLRRLPLTWSMVLAMLGCHEQFRRSAAGRARRWRNPRRCRSDGLRCARRAVGLVAGPAVSAARLRAEARSAARHALARLYLLVWPPTRYAEFMAGLDELDADLLVARVSPTLRAALSLIATECWTDGAEMNDDQDSEPGISTRLLVGFRMVRNAVLLELASGRTRGGRQRAREVFDHLDRLIAADRADRGRRTAPLVAAEFATRTIDVDKESRSR